MNIKIRKIIVTLAAFPEEQGELAMTAWIDLRFLSDIRVERGLAVKGFADATARTFECALKFVEHILSIQRTTQIRRMQINIVDRQMRLI